MMYFGIRFIKVRLSSLKKYIQTCLEFSLSNLFFKVQGGSGGPYLSGWSINFFPYLKENEKNVFVWEKTWLEAYSFGFGGLKTSDFLPTFSKAPVKWFYFGKEIDLMFVGGLFGNHYSSSDKSIKPVFGYGVAEIRN